MEHQELRPGTRRGSRIRGAGPGPRLGEATFIFAACAGAAVMLVGIGVFFRLVTGLSLIP